MLTAIVHALFNSSVAAAFSYLLLHRIGRMNAVDCDMVPAVLPPNALTNSPLRRGLVTQWMP